ncbi:PTS fructose transporter subunit IIC [Peribacillus asahii]|uniref:PTS fructose transporter subunit IIC n=1 Tax=Peribacillus asahii TaxID=228899 RepID=A0A398AYM2_9BACI|nr:fructose-specific PTS transporter subunit EIIC [Peribacillus asahii]RID82154.1 PTS fructose transporter subunit IIC [Peribacillus asahii]
MNITDLIKADTIIMDLQATSKRAVIDELANQLGAVDRVIDVEQFITALLEREEQVTTGIGDGMAFPHAKSEAVKQPAICFGKSEPGVDFQSLDGKPVHLFFLIAINEQEEMDYLDTLSTLTTFLLDEQFRTQLMNAKKKEEVLTLFRAKEYEAKKASAKKILAVTSCPTGIAHTYMAADALKKKAEELGIDFRVETNGSTGVKNALTAAEIADASTIIIAADKHIDMTRFRGKRVIVVPVAEGIRHPEELLNRAVLEEVPIYQGHEEIKFATKGFFIYKHVMNGVSNMLPFVVGGGVLLALSFMFGVNPDDPNYHPFAKALNDIGGSTGAFFLLVPVLAGFIASSIADRPGFAPGMVGGLLAANEGAGFLGGLVAGFLAGYIVLLLKKCFGFLPFSLQGIKPTLLYPVFGVLITGLFMIFIVNEPVTAINEALTGWLKGLSGTNAIMLGMILGAMMAIDLGGPLNKAAFTFGLAAIEAHSFGPQAAIMAGGMVPPLGIAMATTLFKNKFTETERKSGMTNYLLGASFITEGAIPYGAADPIRVIGSCTIGAAITGALTMLFGITLPAPHGGVFVIPLVNHPLLYLISILMGSFITALLLGIWKKQL